MNNNVKYNIIFFVPYHNIIKLKRKLKIYYL